MMESSSSDRQASDHRVSTTPPATPIMKDASHVDFTGNVTGCLAPLMECSPYDDNTKECLESSLPSHHKIEKRGNVTVTRRKTKRESRKSTGEALTAESVATYPRSSLELRKLPVDVLLQPANVRQETTSVLSEDAGEDKLAEEEDIEKETDCLRLLCLRPQFTLRKQMMLSFGSINLITIAIVVMICVSLSILAGENVKSTSSDTAMQLVNESLGYRARYLAEYLTESIILVDTVKFLHEATQDRFEGHPNPTDEYVPFFDMYSETNMYPVKGPAMPLQWNVTPNVNMSNVQEHLQSRWKIYENTPVDTTQASFIMQGACDPLEVDSMGDAFWPNCTDANNDIATGGVVAPSNQTELYYRKGGDMVPILRAIFEQNDAIRDIGLFFLNNGAGAAVNYPHYSVSTQTTYISVGCEWLLSPNPYDPTRNIGSEEMAKVCKPEGEEVSNRLYNPMERDWCRDQASNPDKIFMDARENAWNPGEWLLILGRSVYDRMTQEFVACMYIGINLGKIEELLESSRTSERAEATVIHFDDEGYVVASSRNLTREGRLPIYDSDLGMNKENYVRLSLLVDFNSRWDPVETRKMFEAFSTSDANFRVSVHPMPPIPEEYDPDYRPVFFVVTSFHLEDLTESIEALNDRVDDRVGNIITFTWIFGLVGLVVASVIIFAMAHMLTSPLTNMNNVASEIIGSFGDPTKEDEIRQSGDVSLETNCTPRTELSDVVSEFNIMVTNFSGASEAKTEKFMDDDLENTFPARQDLLDLYKGRSDQLSRYGAIGEHLEFERDEKDDDLNTSSSTQPSISFLHFGPNYSSTKTQSDGRKPGKESPASRTMCTALFLWIVLLIATPLLCITIILSASVITKINIEFARSTDDIQVEYLFLLKQVELSYARLRAGFVSSYTQRFINDLYLMTRYTSWLTFGALDSSESFPAMSSGVEQCKYFADDYTKCPFVKENFVCDCDWKQERYVDTCSNFANASSSRRLQRLYWISEFSNTSDGSRFETSFPFDHYSPQSGSWWDNLTTLPGFNDVSSGSGHNSPYERVRMYSNVPVTLPLYNYHLGESKNTNLGIGIGFENDGTFIAYSGCFSSRHVTLSGWSSNPENQAEIFRPELCPLGKFGFDPRCRGWYHSGRELYATEKRMLHISSPYLFASGEVRGEKTFAQTATIPIFDPSTSEHVGQTLLDFIATPIYSALQDTEYLGPEGFSILITVDSGTAPETIIGPGVSEGSNSIPISDGVLPFDLNCSMADGCEERRSRFEAIVDSMKRGESKDAEFTRKDGNGEIEILHLAYAPVYVTSIEQVDSSDFSRGVSRANQLVYSLGILETQQQMLLPFREIENATKHQSVVAVAVLGIIIFLATVSVVYISYRLAASFSEPMIYLLGLLQEINKRGAGHDPPEVRKIKASKEIVTFSTTLEALFRIIRSANIAFFNGDLEFAYQVLNDALRLFRRLDNKKAIGVASNNLGNILLGIYRKMCASKVEKLYGLTRQDVVARGIAHFHTAIQLGEKAYDEFHEQQGWSPSCLDFMQHLSNRYFNRGLFLLHVKEDHSNPEEIEQLGMRDIQIANDMDQEVVAYGEEIGWGSDDRAEKRFNVNIIRIRGYNILYELDYRHDWGVKELMEETVGILKTEYKNPCSDFFSNMSLAGRLQDLEIQMMRYYSIHEDLETAAKIAVRMLIEDERIFTEAMREALTVLIDFAESDEADAQFRTKMVPILRSFRKAVMELINEKRQSALEDMESISISFTKSIAGSVVNRDKIRISFPAAGEESTRIVTMEDF
ncbi:hypothetical protein IV203_000399 [Nitzschia inconspicua]|uniref:Uncharacterized protein n=1 Tax=Nitzschia inconspicua TaxID=303405 RepID=A0A9K3L6S0_9STRA|nr:hypothetical protein IV203_000399 [Nitzschia inconspicua]